MLAGFLAAGAWGMAELLAFAAELLGDPLGGKQEEIYILILIVMGLGASIALVVLAYLFFWLADLRQKSKNRIRTSVLQGHKFSRP